MNIHYKSNNISKFFSQNRVQWNQFYPSEKYIFERIFSESKSIETVLDVGCACGGLGMALNERFGIRHYTGIDINKEAIDAAGSPDSIWPMPVSFECGDIVATPALVKDKQFDLVVSLGCADWNTDTSQIIKTCWDHTAVGGYFIFSFRLTNKKTLNNIRDSYQYIHYDFEVPVAEDAEKAPYVVTNANEMFEMVNGFMPKASKILAYGYWGNPSMVAVTPYSEVVFSVVAARKNNCLNTEAELLLPLNLFIKNV
jgi:SAM-dependent methyltransferase